MRLPIEEHALIGDYHAAALSGPDDSIDWLRLLQFESGARFAAPPGDPDHGRRLLVPVEGGARSAAPLPRRHADPRNRVRGDYGALRTVVQDFSDALLPDDIVIGGGQSDRLKRLPPRMRRDGNAASCLGGFRLWEEPAHSIATSPAGARLSNDEGRNWHFGLEAVKP